MSVHSHARPAFLGHTVIITGGSAGIGRAAAQLFADRGANLVLIARRPEPLAAAAAALDIGARVMTEALDVGALAADPRRCQALFDTIAERFGGIHALINNAAVNHRGPVEHLPAEDLAHIVDVNLRTPIVLTRRILPYLRASGGGAIVNVASLAGRTPVPGGATYSASKFGLRAFSLALAQELAGSGISVSLVSPGPVLTDFIMTDLDNVPDLVFSQPMSTAEQVAQAVLACAQDGRAERALPRLSGYLSTLGYLAPGLKRRLDPLLTRLGRRSRARWRQQRAKSE